MLKRNAIVKFVLIVLIAIVGILLCVLPVGVPYSSNNYNGFINAINKDVELAGGVTATYTCSFAEGNDGDLSDAIDRSLPKISSILEVENFRQCFVERQGGNKIRILTSTEVYEAFDYLQDGRELYFTAAEASDTVLNPEDYLNSDDVDTVTIDIDYDSSSYQIKLTFKSSAETQIKQLKSISKSTTNQKVYVYLGEKNSDCLLTSLDYKDIDNEEIIISSTSERFSTTSSDGARKVAYSIVGGMLDVKLNLLEVSHITPILGKNTQLYLAISLFITIFLVFVFLCIRYGDLGLLGCLALIFYLVLFAFMLQAIPFINLTLSGVVGSVVAFLIATMACCNIFENIKSEYAIGKKIHLACKGGFKRSLWTILDSHAILAFVGIFIWVLAPSSIKCFGITLLVGLLLSLFSSLALLRWFVNNYLAINSTKNKRMHLYRDANVKELKEEQQVEVIVDDDATTEEVNND